MIRTIFAIKAAVALAIAAAVPQTSYAATIVGAGSLPGANKINLPPVNQTGVGPITFGGATWSSNISTALFGWTGGYVFANGTIAPGEPIIALNAPNTDTNTYADMYLRFPTLTSGFLAEIFWTNPNQYSVSGFFGAYNSSGGLLDYFELNNNGNFNGRTSGYYGFSRATADIAYVRLSNAYIGARDLRWVGPEINPPTVGGIPEPKVWAMMILGFGLIGTALRTRKAQQKVLAD